MLELDNLEQFSARLEMRLPELTKSQQRIAHYLLANYDQAAFLAGADLARLLDVSEATLVRFARALGYPGFPELRRTLQQIFRDKVSPAARLQHKLEDLSKGHEHILRQVVEMERQYLAEALQGIAPDDFDRAVEIVLAARRLFVRGGGPSAMLADLAELRLARFGLNVVAINESGPDLAEKLQKFSTGDAVIITGFTRLSAELVATVEHARAAGCRSILLTDTLAAPFRDKVDVVLAARRGPVSAFHSLCVPMAILNALFLAVAMARPQEVLASLDRLQGIRSRYGLDYNT